MSATRHPPHTKHNEKTTHAPPCGEVVGVVTQNPTTSQASCSKKNDDAIIGGKDYDVVLVLKCKLGSTTEVDRAVMDCVLNSSLYD